MKNKYTKYILLTLSAVCIFSSCQKNSTKAISVLLDLTDDHINQVSTQDIKNRSSITKNLNNGELIRFVPIIDIGFSKSFEYKLDPVNNELFGNEYLRKKDTVRYFKQIDSVITLIQIYRSAKTASIIFKILTEELNRLSVFNYEEKVLIINSDLMENSFINFYNPNTLLDLIDTPEKVSQLMLAKYPLVNLKGIEIYIVYLPKDIEDNTRFEIISGFYKRLFESKGAKVHIVGNL